MITYSEANTFVAESMNFLEILIEKTSHTQRDAFFSLKKNLTIDISGNHHENALMIKKLRKESKKNKFFYFLNMFSSKKFEYQHNLSKITLRLQAIKENSISSNKILKNINLSVSCLNHYLNKDNIFSTWNSQDAFYFSIYHELGHLLQNEYPNFDTNLSIFLNKYPNITNYLNRKDARSYNLFSFILPTHYENNITQDDVALSLLLDSIFSNVNTIPNSYKKEIKTNLEECFADIYALLFMSLKNGNFNQNKKAIIELRKTELSKIKTFGHYTIHALENLVYFANQYRISLKKLDFEAYHKLIKIAGTQSLMDLMLMRLKKNDSFNHTVADDLYHFIQSLTLRQDNEKNFLMTPSQFEVIDFSNILGEGYLSLPKETLANNFMFFLDKKLANFKNLSEN